MAAHSKDIAASAPDWFRDWLTGNPALANAVSQHIKEQLAERLQGLEADRRFQAYQNRPYEFSRDYFQEDYPPKIVEMMNSVRDYPVTLVRSANSIGKTFAAARIAIWWFKTYMESKVYTIAPGGTNALRRGIWAEIGSLARRHESLFRGNKVNILNIYRSEDSFIAGVNYPITGTPEEQEAGFSGKHAPHLLMIADEGDSIPEAIYRAINSCLTGSHGRLLVMFNPRQESGPLARMERDGLANVIELNAFDHPNVVEDKNIYPGAVDRATTVRRVNQWSRPLAPNEQPDRECFEVPEYLVGEVGYDQAGNALPPLKAGYRKATENEMYYMVLGRYPARSTSQLISHTDIENARDRWDAYVAEFGEVPDDQPVMGLDIAEFGADSTVATFRYENFVARQESWYGVDPDLSASMGAEKYQKRNALACYVDANGVGAAVPHRMMRLGAAAYGVKAHSKPTISCDLNGEIIGEFNSLDDQLWWQVREWLRTENAMLPPDEDLIEELVTPNYQIAGGKIKVTPKKDLKEILRRSPDKAESLKLTFSPRIDGPIFS